ncbi:hypothetical protein PAPYR_10652 [Paratrimastix pyriformis]|uniref:Protein kinase domain-containing protein n=1 Tax=Paratrimastix pyriformis TaxID=342808 RepID=A0ABQ8U5H8_9EUKA|nr:hypothetical protein PAPYR_10652 [Paratrimastix pyriformis]
MTQLDHPNILPLLAQPFVDRDVVILITAFCDQGNLDRILGSSRLSDSTLRRHLISLLSQTPHDPPTPDHGGIMVIGDMGLLTKDRSTETVGTRLFMAPEVMYSQAYDAKADLFSLGLVFLLMIANWSSETLFLYFCKEKDPAPGPLPPTDPRREGLPCTVCQRNPELFVNAINAAIPPGLAEVRSAIQALLSRQAADRPTAQQARLSLEAWHPTGSLAPSLAPLSWHPWRRQWLPRDEFRDFSTLRLDQLPPSSSPPLPLFSQPLIGESPVGQPIQPTPSNELNVFDSDSSGSRNELRCVICGGVARLRNPFQRDSLFPWCSQVCHMALLETRGRMCAPLRKPHDGN